MARKPGVKGKPVVEVTHTYVSDPEAVARGLDLWAFYLARHLARQARPGRPSPCEKP